MHMQYYVYIYIYLVHVHHRTVPGIVQSTSNSDEYLLNTGCFGDLPLTSLNEAMCARVFQIGLDAGKTDGFFHPHSRLGTRQIIYLSCSDLALFQGPNRGSFGNV